MANATDFAVKTKAELLRLGAEAEHARPSHNCPEGDDKAPCRHCKVYRDLHKCIDDHLTQLFDEVPA
jgi:hypothetical protein